MPRLGARRAVAAAGLALSWALSGALSRDLPPGAAQPVAACPPGEPLQVLPPAAPPPAPAAADTAPQAPDYRQRLRPTAYGWPRLDHWCVWVEPAAEQGPAARWEQAWLGAVEAALADWAELVGISRVEDPERAQIRILRRRPPLRNGRASHGRAELELVLIQRGSRQLLEPRVTVQLSPGQRPEALQATALHELGHALGLWGHSDQAADAMAAAPGARPVLALTARDRASFRWLQRQAGLAAPLSPAPPGPAGR